MLFYQIKNENKSIRLEIVIIFNRISHLWKNKHIMKHNLGYATMKKHYFLCVVLNEAI